LTGNRFERAGFACWSLCLPVNYYHRRQLVFVGMSESDSSGFTVYASALRSQIDCALADYCNLAPGCPPKLREAISYSLLAPGKRLRPILVLLAAEACGGDVRAAMPAACAVEMVHAYSLIHDDLPAMDDDDLRRGRPTCHKVFGEALAILAGDALLAMAFEVLASNVRPPAPAAACCAALAEAAGPCQLVGGQADDILAQRDPQHQTAHDLSLLESIHRRKTGAMIRVSLRLGATIAGAGDSQLDALDRYGECVGLAFQITDDLLDVLSTGAELGKAAGTDAARGKLTYPSLLGQQQSAERAAALIAAGCQALECFGPRAEPLSALARYVLARKR
jgi:geranylgeranyl diphosphate synthase type II